MWETLLAKVLGWVPAPWSGVRLGYEATARLCTSWHGPMVWWEGMPPVPPQPLHIDAELKLWDRTEHRTTVREVKASAAGQQLHADFREMTLDAGSKPEEQNVELRAPKSEHLSAQAGDVVAVELLLTRGRSRKLKLPIAPEKERES